MKNNILNLVYWSGLIALPICLMGLLFQLLMSGFLFPKGFKEFADWKPFLIINIPSILLGVGLIYLTYKCIDKTLFLVIDFSFFKKIILVIIIELWPTLLLVLWLNFFLKY